MFPPSMIPVVPVAALFVVVAVVASAIRIASEWQRAVVLRFGRFTGVRGPGLFFLIPFVDRIAATIDLRIQTAGIAAEQALTRDTVAVGVDAIIFWQVEDAARAALAIRDYARAIESVAQTSLREMIGASDLGRLLSDRQSADEQLRLTIGRKIAGWGVAIRSVEIRDVMIPSSLQDAMSRQAQAERERDARVTLASAEQAVAVEITRAAELYAADPAAFALRQMNLLFEMNKARGATVLIPTDLAAALGRALPALGPKGVTPT